VTTEARRDPRARRFPRRFRRALELGFGLAVVIGWAVTLRPTSLGGPATYVVVRGDSMLPGFHSGDLVVLQAGSGYAPGDVIGYRVPDGEVGAGHVVVHRIVAGNAGSGYTMEGDNNPAPDPWLPRRVDVAGRVWLLLPGLGRALAVAHQPVVAGAIGASIVVMVLLTRRPAAFRPVGPRQSRRLVPLGPSQPRA
jgi:signal peptidase I